jgi:hypothetical protein
LTPLSVEVDPLRSKFACWFHVAEMPSARVIGKPTVLFLLAVLLFCGFEGGAAPKPGDESLAVISTDLLLDNTQTDTDLFLPQPLHTSCDSLPAPCLDEIADQRESTFEASYRSRAPPFACFCGSHNTIG